MIAPEHDVVIAGRYTLVRPLAEGGMGSVWVARHRDLEIDVAVKFMAPSLLTDAGARLRFEREARVAARLRSQHVVQILDYGVEAGSPYIVMELLRGESLSARLARDGRLGLREAAPLVVQICKALRTAHEAGLVHRDLKPGNVFLAREDEDEVVKVLDFGIAKAQPGVGEASADTATGVILGSINYMSPEQIRCARLVDHRSDLWSVGVIVYRMLTGRLPFPGRTQWEALLLVGHDARPPPPAATPGLPARIDDFFERALARDPERRFQSMPELSEAFSAMALELPGPAPATEEDEAPTIRAVLVPEPRARQAPRSVRPPVGRKWNAGRAWLNAAVLTMIVVLGWAMRLAVRAETAPPRAARSEVASEIAPSVAVVAVPLPSPVSPAVEPAAPPPPPPHAPTATETVKPSGSARAVVPRPPAAPTPRPVKREFPLVTKEL